MANDHDSLCVCVGACMPLCVCMCMCPCMFLSAEDLLLLHLPHYLHSLGDYCRAGRDLRRCVLLSGFQSAARVCTALFYACCFSFFLFSLSACHLSLVHIAALLPPSHPAACAVVGVLYSTRFHQNCCCFCVFPARPDGSRGGRSFAPLHLSCKSSRPHARKWKNEQMNFHSRKDEGFAGEFWATHCWQSYS